MTIELKIELHTDGSVCSSIMALNQSHALKMTWCAICVQFYL